MKKYFLVMFGVLVVPSAAWAAPENVSENTAISFGNVVLRNSGAVIKMEPDGTISQGSSLILTPPNPRRGRYRVQGDAGTVDIAISNVSTCDPGVMLDSFAADWLGVVYSDISSTPITGAAFDGNEWLALGARISYGNSVPLGSCSSTYDLTVIYY